MTADLAVVVICTAYLIAAIAWCIHQIRKGN